jgi:TetR/AcrR family transcriptional repressor of nem operon
VSTELGTPADNSSDTATTVLDIAERLVQLRGFNGFSYADAAAELGITKAALHYHFASKAELGEALIARYASRFGSALATIDATTETAPAKLAAYTKLYLDVVTNERMCLCGMLAAEHATLPAPMREAVVRFFDDNEAWLGAVFRQGRRDGTLRVTGTPAEAARLTISGLEGAMLVARLHNDPSRFRDAADRLLATFTIPPIGRANARR